MQTSKFRIALVSALAKVNQATGWHICELEQDGRDAGKVVVEKRASAPRVPSQTNTSHARAMARKPYEFNDDEI